MITQLKIELDCKRAEDETQVYCISKVSFIKLANPSINSSLKGVNKNNIWFVNLLNYIQAPNLSTASGEEEQNFSPEPTGEEDDFISYLK